MGNIFSEETNSFKIQLSDKLKRKIFRICQKSYPNESGGILIGKYSSDLKTAIIYSITDAPSDSKMGKTWFKRGVNGLQELLNRKWVKSQQFYLGEWHFHPNGTPIPSQTDIQEMRKISKNHNYNCPEPILLIASNYNEHWELGEYIFYPNKSYTRIYRV